MGRKHGAKSTGAAQDSAESLTVFLAKKGVTEAGNLLKGTSGLKTFKIKDQDGDLGTLYIQPRSSHVPSWAEFFEGQVDQKEFGRVASAAAVLIVPLEKRTVVLTFGQGRHLIDVQSVENRFGRRVSLNAIAEDRVRSLDKQNFETIGRHTRVQSNKEARPTDLGIDFDEDLLRTLAGAPSDSDLGKTLSGVDSLHAMVAVDLSSLRTLLEIYVEQFDKDVYKKKFPWVDNTIDVADKETIARLDAAMLEKIKEGDFDRCWLSIPEPIDWGMVLGFRYRRGARQPILHDISFQSFLQTVEDADQLTVEQLQRRDIRCVSADDIDIFTWSVYKCIYCEVDLNGATYLLNAGDWYAVEKNFVKQIDAAVKQIPKYQGALPEYEDDSEGDYCDRVAAASGGVLALMDRKLISIGGSTSKVEFCDLYSKKQDLIHIKRYGGSGVLSHLFGQGTVSGQLFASDADFRKAVNGFLPATHKLTNTADRPDTSKFTVVYAVVSQQSGQEITLPFFSRVKLRQATKILRGLGYEVAIAKIPVSKEYASTLVYKSKK
jgi:uncharacterized protein (TIGR04141 family)